LSIATLVTRGYGSFGTIADVVRAGYNSGDSSIISDQDASKIAQFVWKEILDNSLEAQELMRIFASALVGKATGLKDGRPIYRNLADTKARITGVSDKYGNREDVTLDGT